MSWLGIAAGLAGFAVWARHLTAAGFDTVSLRRVTWPALLVSSALFGLMHHDVRAGVGLLYRLAARRHGQLGDAVLAHGITNARSSPSPAR